MSIVLYSYWSIFGKFEIELNVIEPNIYTNYLSVLLVIVEYDYCPTEGRMLIDLNMADTYSWNETYIIAQAGSLKIGGAWQPEGCQARWKMLMIVPFRDRENHLKAFLAHMHPILQRQRMSYRILVVEQVVYVC